MSDSNGKFTGAHRPRRRYRPSLFGPIVLIAIGILFLLNNFGLVPGLAWNWVALLQLWPLWLIFIGVNVIVRQAPGVLGSFLSALVGVLAVAVFGYVLLFGEDNALLNKLGVPNRSVEVQTESIEFGAGDVSTAVINLNFSATGVDMYALDDSNNLIEGTVSYTGELIFNPSVSGSRANINLDTRSDNNDWFVFLNPANWASFDDEHRWQIGLNPRVETELRLDISSGSAYLDLSELTLSELEVNGGSGRMELFLPGGDYDVNYDSNSGSTKMTLPDNGRHTIELDGSSGSLTLYLPDSMEARLEIDGGSGSFNIDRDRFTQVSGDQRDEGVWETAGYDDAPDRVNLIIDISSGSVNIREP